MVVRILVVRGNYQLAIDYACIIIYPVLVAVAFSWSVVVVSGSVAVVSGSVVVVSVGVVVSGSVVVLSVGVGVVVEPLSELPGVVLGVVVPAGTIRAPIMGVAPRMASLAAGSSSWTCPSSSLAWGGRLPRSWCCR